MPSSITSTTSRTSTPGAVKRRAMAAGSLTIIDALNDEKLFASHFRGPEGQATGLVGTASPRSWRGRTHNCVQHATPTQSLVGPRNDTH